MSGYKRDKKEEEDGSGPVFAVDKSTVLQETRYFNENNVSGRRCVNILTKLLYLINQGESIGTREATDAFFATTKLFQLRDQTVRQLIFIVIKEMANLAENVIIVTSSLQKDMTGKDDLFRGPAIRALCKITDLNMMQALERYMKQGIVDKVPPAASAAIVSSIHLTRTGSAGTDLVRRWINEVQEAVNSDNVMVQYHALGLLYNIRRLDRLAVVKMLGKYVKQPLRSPFASTFLIRLATKTINEDEMGSDSTLFDFIESCLRHKSDMVVLEAARAIVSLRAGSGSGRDLNQAISALQSFCTSPKPVLRFAAVRTLSLVAMEQPQAVAVCNLDLEGLITDQNRSIATLAITTLLKTGTESSIDRLMKQIQSFMSEISDEFKVVVVDAIRSLCTKYPRKHSVLMFFLSQALRDDGGFEFKRAIVAAVMGIIEEIPESKEVGLSHLCEFIEDCEHTPLAIQILNLLGKEGPRTLTPAKFIRYIYNRVLLEQPVVRAAAVAALAKFGAACEHLRPSCIVLLERCLLDVDDEVRDRATLYVHLLKSGDKALISQYILNALPMAIAPLERALHQCTLAPSETPFDIKTVPVVEPPAPKRPEPGVPVAGVPGGAPAPGAAPSVSRQEIYMEQLSRIPQFQGLGQLFKSSKPVELTDSGTEYQVSVIKHIFDRHIVFQFDCTNTLNDQLLEKVFVAMETSDDFEVAASIPLASLPYNQPGVTYTCVKLSDDPMAVIGSFSCTLKFNVRDCDPATGEPETDMGYDDDYILENLDVNVADFIVRVNKPNFAAAWEELNDMFEIDDTYALTTVSTLDGKLIFSYFVMANVDNVFFSYRGCQNSCRYHGTSTMRSQ